MNISINIDCCLGHKIDRPTRHDVRRNGDAMWNDRAGPTTLTHSFSISFSRSLFLSGLAGAVRSSKQSIRAHCHYLKAYNATGDN